IAWAETPVDANDPQFWDILEVCEKETKRRGKVKEWTGKVVRTQGKIQRLESHEQVMDNFGVSEELKVKVKAFLRYCWVNGHLKTNEMLEDILFTLDRTYESDDDKIGAIEKAMRHGFYDIKRCQ
ncbi:MAG: hypothetical protein MJ072_04300, partial [Clostridia bacterium]|nr:hypothetical protein [Clostridia bacterium]